MDFGRSDQIGFVAAAGRLRAKILSGEYPPGTQLPSDPGDPRSGRWAGRDKTECGLHI